MHELSIALSVIDGVMEEVERHGDARVKTIYLRVGIHSGVENEALLFCYELASQDTPLADSRLVIEEVPATIDCAVCHQERVVRNFPLLICAECGAEGGRLVRGKELEINRLELAS